MMGIGRKIAGGFLILLGIGGLYDIPRLLYYAATFGLNPAVVGGMIGAFVVAPLMIYYGIKLIKSK